MNNTILKRIADLKESIIRMDDIKKVESETRAIFDAIDQIENKEEKHQAMDAMMDIAIHMISEMNPTGISKLLDAVNELEKKPKTKVKSISVKVNRYLDATVVEVSEKISYSELLEVLEKVQEDFKDEIISLAVDRRKKCMEIEFVNSDDMIVPVKHWKLCDESKDIYMEGFAEYLECLIK